jgi:4-amino-4-deoxy-L-arabinose transferase-like glycosyltransferase
VILAGGERADGQPAWSRLELASLAAAMLIVLLLTAPSLGTNSFWFDEVFSMTTAHDWAGMYHTFIAYENNMALYYVLLHLWIAMFGEGEAAVRTLSMLFAIATVPVVHALARRLFDVRVAICADLLLTISKPMLDQADEARSYALLLLLSALSVLLFIEGINCPRWWVWICFSVSAAASVYAHYFGILAVAACYAAAPWLGLRRLPWRHLIGAAAALAALLIPLAVWHPPNSSQIDWIERPGIKFIGFFISYFANGTKILAVLFAACIVFGIWRRMRGDREGRRQRAWPFAVLLAWLVLPAAATFAASWIIRPVFMPKYLLGSLPALLILAATGIASLPNRLALPLMAAIVLPFGYSYLIIGRLSGTIENWRDLTARVVSSAHPGDATICFPYYCARPFAYYLGRQHDPHPDLVPHEISSGPYHPGGGTALLPPDLPALKRLIGEHPRLWLIDCTSRGGEYRTTIKAALAAAYRTSSLIEAENVQAVLYSDPLP